MSGSVDVRPEVLIRRARSEVAASWSTRRKTASPRPRNHVSTRARPGPLVTESTVEREARFLGRTFTDEHVVSEHEPDRLVELVVERPFPMVVRDELEDADGGTPVSIRTKGTPGRFFRWATPIVSGQVHTSIEGDLERLRAVLDHDAS